MVPNTYLTLLNASVAQILGQSSLHECNKAASPSSPWCFLSPCLQTSYQQQTDTDEEEDEETESPEEQPSTSKESTWTKAKDLDEWTNGVYFSLVISVLVRLKKTAENLFFLQYNYNKNINNSVDTEKD